MSLTIFLSIAIVIAVSVFAIWIEAFLNRKEEFASIEEWHNFRTAFKKETK